MDPTLQTIVTIFVILAAIAMIVQAAVFVGIFIATRRTQKKLAEILPQTKKVLETSQKTIEITHKYITEIGTRTTALLDSTKEQMVKVEDLVTDASSRAKVQMERAEMVLDDSMSRAHETVVLVQRGILKPIREVHGVLSGFRAALAFLGRTGRPTVDHVTSDEEMFI